MQQKKMSKSAELGPRYNKPCGVGVHVDISTQRQEGVNADGHLHASDRQLDVFFYGKGEGLLYEARPCCPVLSGGRALLCCKSINLPSVQFEVSCSSSRGGGCCEPERRPAWSRGERLGHDKLQYLVSIQSGWNVEDPRGDKPGEMSSVCRALHCTKDDAFTKHGVIGKIFFVKIYLITPPVFKLQKWFLHQNGAELNQESKSDLTNLWPVVGR